MNLKEGSIISRPISKTRKGIGLLRYLSKYLPRHTLNELFKLYVRPHLDYGDVIYHIPAKVCEFSGNTILPNLMEKLESVQYSAALAVSGAWRGTSREKLYAGLGWESLSSRRWNGRLTLFYKIINNMSPAYTTDPIPQLQQSQYALRKQDVFGRIREGQRDFNLVSIPVVCLIGMFYVQRSDLHQPSRILRKSYCLLCAPPPPLLSLFLGFMTQSNYTMLLNLGLDKAS